MANAEARPSSTEAPATPSLPLELIAAIVEEAVTIHVEACEPAPAAELCLLCKALLPYARGALYRTVHLAEPLAAEPSDEEVERLGLENAVRSNSSNMKLFDSLAAARHLARLVVEIRVHGRELDMYDGWQGSTLQYDLGKIFQACTNIRAVQGLDRGSSAWWTYSKVFKGSAQVQQLGRINLYWLSMLPIDLYALHDAHALRHLSLDNICADVRAPLPTFRLTSFAVHLTAEPPAVLDFFLSQSSSSLRRLTIPRSPAQPDLTRFKSLEHLTFVATPPCDVGVTVEQLLQTIESISSPLTTLRLAVAPLNCTKQKVDASANRVVKQDERDGLLNRLPLTIRHLDVRTLPYSTASLLAYLDSAVSPSLHRLDAMRPTVEEEHCELQEACWSRGVELYSYCGGENGAVGV